MYTTQDRIEAYLKRPLTDNEAFNIDELIEMISSNIDTYTGRNWLPVDEEDNDHDADDATDRTFDGSGHKELQVDDFQELFTVTILDRNGNPFLELEASATYNFILYPLNTDTKQSIYLRLYHFPLAAANVRINAVWGSGVVPTGVVQIATALVGNYLNKTPVNQLASESIEGYSYKSQVVSEFVAEEKSLMDRLSKYQKILL